MYNKEYRKRYHQEHREEENKKNQVYYQENKEEILKRTSNYVKEHIDKVREYNRNYRKTEKYKQYLLKHKDRHNAYGKKYRQAHKAELSVYNREYQKVWQSNNKERCKKYSYEFNQRNKRIAFEHYGGVPPKCTCCGEKEFEFLTIDHINNDGKEHRKLIGAGSYALYRWLLKNNFPDGFQIMCMNCNWAKGHHEKGWICPHQMKKLEVVSTC